MDSAREKTGNIWTAMSHVVTILIGSGILAMAWTFAQLGWIGSPIVLLIFCGVTYYTSTILADCYRYPDPVSGTVNKEYIDAIRCYLGRRSVFWCGFIQYASIWATLLGYTITASDSMSAIRKVNCLHKGGGIDCRSGYCSTYVIISFGAVQVLLSQLPSLDSISWLSFFSVATSVVYSAISLGIGFAKWSMHNKSHGTLFGAIGESLVDKATNVFLAIGNVAFTYSYSDVQIEIQDTLRAPPAENKTMKRASMYGLSLATVFCMLLGVSGYAAFGNIAPGNILSGDAISEPFWLIHLANACVVLHFVTAYQVFAQLIFARLEACVALRWPRAAASYDMYHLLHWTVRISMLKLVARTIVIVLTTVITAAMPYFNPVLGIIGALGFWPLTVHFPVKMHLARLKISRDDLRWWILHAMSLMCLLLSILMGAAAVRDIIVHKLG